MDILLNETEKVEEQLGPDNLAAAERAVREEGYVILREAINHESLDLLLPRMTADSGQLIEARKWGGAGRLKGHLQQAPPPFAPYVFRDIVANPFAIQLTRKILGDGLYNRFYNGNTNCPNSLMQPLHADSPQLWPNLPSPHPPASLIVNVTLVDVTEENGSTELWPGTHLITSDEERRVSTAMEEQRRSEMPPIRANTSKGSLLVRDARLWHRGMPNQSDTIRHMIAMIHNIHWLQGVEKLWFDSRCQEVFPVIEGFNHNAFFSSQPLSYLYHRYAVPSPE